MHADNNEAGFDFMKRLFERSELAIVVTNSGGIIRHVNGAFTRLTGYSPENAIGKNPRILKSGIQPPAFYHALWQNLIRNGTWQGEVWNRKKNGRLYCEWLTITTMTDEHGIITGYFGIFSDITAAKRSSRYLQFIAGHDNLTRLPNRHLFRRQLQLDIEDAKKQSARLGVVFLDLDNFKSINDRFGHAAGDEVLRITSVRLQKAIRAGDRVARTGGDEFNLILRSLGNPSETKAILQDICDNVNLPISVADGTQYVISASAGLSLFPDHSEDPEDLLKRADEAMYAAKLAGKNAFRIVGEANA